MEEDIYLDKLVRRDIKPTAIRLLVIKEMMQAERAVSLLDLETLLDTVDKSTISRTIALFLSHHLIHSIDDGSGSLKYAVCDNSCNCVVQDLHSHFYCEKDLLCTALIMSLKGFVRNVPLQNKKTFVIM